MHDMTVTVFNHYKDQKKNITWYPTIITGCNVNMDKAAIVAKYGSESKDNVVVDVPYTLSDGIKTIVGKSYLPPKEWSRQTNDMLASTITFADGQEADFVLIGEWSDEDVIGDEDYGIDGFYNYMNQHYDYVFSITASAVYTVIPHFEITGA